jgi:hypothetical protein
MKTWNRIPERYQRAIYWWLGMIAVMLVSPMLFSEEWVGWAIAALYGLVTGIAGYSFWPAWNQAVIEREEEEKRLKEEIERLEEIKKNLR